MRGKSSIVNVVSVDVLADAGNVDADATRANRYHVNQKFWTMSCQYICAQWSEQGNKP